MTRAEKIKKLANAIKEYRGSYRKEPTKDNPDAVKWIRGPKPHEIIRVKLWLSKLRVNVTPELISRIDGFKSKDEFFSFLQELES